MTLKLPVTLLFVILFSCPPLARSQQAYTDPTTGMQFAFVKGGCFEMGDSTGDGDPNERPVHRVCLSDFYIGMYEVTNSQYQKYMAEHQSGSSDENNLNGANQPVVNVSWEDATAFAEWLSSQSGEHYRLPTESEWEFAARAGSNQSRFWGNNPDEACTYANVADMTAKKIRPQWTTFFCDDQHFVSAEVGSFKPNKFNLYDVLGNVWEWCLDVYNSEAYSKLPQDDPVYQGSGEYRVMRGGGWSNGPLGIRSSHRVGLSPNFGHHALGFRLVKAAK